MAVRWPWRVPAPAYGDRCLARAIGWSLSSKHRGFVQAIVAPDGHTLFALEEADPWVIRAFDLLTGRELSPPIESGDGRGIGPNGRGS